ncbi:hypothetical protein EVB41_078 [Rhizobium phage RHph_TM3_14A]|nr:hypothetical protein EVB29_079 [Rhizobium phage RHph_TM27A]QIG66999.1 hypothetical protein EVB30_079 [Rhizobium phage RHph_TM27B]QIG67087.1 hypothetical protein EVB31_077 [Rhizobium phage RHph_TM29]QIG67543.1 hypothetical protein EVB41_078 [Rhizobium phage RHph_TM3_14A]
MRTIVRKSKLFHAALTMLVVFIPLVFLVDAAKLYVLLGAILFTVSVSVVHAYWPPLKLALRQSITSMNFVDYLTMGIVLIFAFTAVREAYVTYTQVFNPTPVSRTDDFYIPLAFSRYGSIVGAYMALAARHFLMGPRFMYRVPGWPRAVISIAVGIIAGSMLIWLSPPVTL